MKKGLFIFAVSFMAINLSNVFSGQRVSPFPPVSGNSIVFDDMHFDGLPSDKGNVAIIGKAAGTVRGGISPWKRLPKENNPLPEMPSLQMYPERRLRFGPNGNMKEIRCGKVAGSIPKQTRTFSDGWEYHTAGKVGVLDIAIKKTKGGNAIVLIDRARGRFLSITQPSD